MDEDTPKVNYVSKKNVKRAQCDTETEGECSLDHEKDRNAGNDDARPLSD